MITLGVFPESLEALPQKMEEFLRDLITRTCKNQKFSEILIYSVLPAGKCMRSFLSLSIAEMIGIDAGRAWSIAAAIELIHCYSIIHDDLPAMDDGITRRGKICCHRIYGEASALLAGNYLSSMAFNLICTHCESHELVKLFSTAIEKLIIGQYMDINMDLTNPMDKTEIITLYANKTAELFKVSCLAPTILATRLEQSDISSLSDYGLNIGLAFQILDDLDDCELPSCFTKEEMIELAKQFLQKAYENLNSTAFSGPNRIRLLKVAELMKTRCTTIS